MPSLTRSLKSKLDSIVGLTRTPGRNWSRSVERWMVFKAPQRALESISKRFEGKDTGSDLEAAVDILRLL